MRYCPSCHIDFTGVLDRCPLCGSKLEGTPEGMIFPENEFARTKKLAKRSMIALTFAALAFVAFLCVRTHASAVTGIASFAAVIVNYIFIRNVVVHSPSFLRIIERYFLVVMALALLLLLATGDSRLATYVVPALTLVALFFNGVARGGIPQWIRAGLRKVSAVQFRARHGATRSARNRTGEPAGALDREWRGFGIALGIAARAHAQAALLRDVEALPSLMQRASTQAKNCALL